MLSMAVLTLGLDVILDGLENESIIRKYNNPFMKEVTGIRTIYYFSPQRPGRSPWSLKGAAAPELSVSRPAVVREKATAGQRGPH